MPKGSQIFQMAMKKVTPSIPSRSKVYPNWNFWFENIPSGNPGYVRNFSKILLLEVCSHLKVLELRLLSKVGN
jgi:hypothetical protein